LDYFEVELQKALTNAEEQMESFKVDNKDFSFLIRKKYVFFSSLEGTQ